ncbi:hypothetical protein [Pantoea sp.]|uniref:hypothetical protein n=1 Tax=Pantoea sp. TaxID=69393 RepID=UPI0031DC7191
MSNESLLKTMLDHDVFVMEDKKVPGIAQLAVDKGYDTLSAAQKHVLSPFMSHGCDGVENPGGHHNDCENVLTGSELESAYENRNYYDAMLCPQCVDELEEYRRQWERISRE